MRNEKISSAIIEKITGMKFDDEYTYEEFMETYPKEDFSITVSFNEKWANFVINDERFGWNIEEKRFAKTIYDTDLPKKFINDLQTLLSTISDEDIKEYWS